MGVFKLFNSPQNIEECFNKSESYPDGEIHVTFDGSESDNVFKIHRMILACKNLAFKQLLASSQRITISKHDPKLVRKLLFFYYSGKLEWSNNEIIPLLQLSHEYFAPEIVVSLLHYLHDNFTSIIQDKYEESLKLLHIFNHVNTMDSCKNTFIDTILDPNSFMNDMLKPLVITRQRSSVNTFTKHYVTPFKFKERTNLNFHERYGGKIWNEKFKTIKVKCLECLQVNFTKFIKSETFLSIGNIEEMKQLLLEMSKLNNFGGGGQFLPAILNWLNHNESRTNKYLSILFTFLQELSEICLPELTISKNKQEESLLENDFKLTIELPTPPKREPAIAEKKEENTPEISITKKKNPISFLGIDMEEANSASTPGSPVISLVSSPHLDETIITPPYSSKYVETTPPSSTSCSSSSSSVLPSTPASDSPTTSSTESKRASRSKSAFIRPRNEQERGTFGHLKRLATPFAFSHSERDDAPSHDTPPKTTFEVEEETLSDWQEVGRVVSYVPVKRVVAEEIVTRNPQQ